MQQQSISRAPVVVVVIFAIVATVLVLIGMQRPSEPPPEVDITTAGTAAEPRPVTVIMRDYRFDPTPVVLVPGETVRFTIFNAGLEVHDFVIGDAGVQQAWSEADAAATPPTLLATAPPASVPPGTGGLRVFLRSGEQATIDYAVPAGEQLSLLCHIPGHIEKGMIGRVDLREVPLGASSAAQVPQAPARTLSEVIAMRDEALPGSGPYRTHTREVAEYDGRATDLISKPGSSRRT